MLILKSFVKIVGIAEIESNSRIRLALVTRNGGRMVTSANCNKNLFPDLFRTKSHVNLDAGGEATAV